MSEGTNVSVKFGTGDAPWLTVYGNTPGEIATFLLDAFALDGSQLPTLDAVIVAANSKATSLWTAASTLGAKPEPQAQTSSWSSQSRGNQQSSQPATGGAGGSCEHGVRVYKEGTSKAGKAYKGWFCPRSVDGCKPEWA